jgi:nucleoid-associated protein YgaU
VRATRIAAAAGVVAVGVAAAWPFRQQPPRYPAPPAALPLELTLRRQDVTLEPRPAGDESPAVGLDAADTPGLTAIRPAGYSPAGNLKPLRPDLENLAPPPDLPVAFDPVALTPALGWESFPAPAPTWSGSWSEKDIRPRSYKLRDGDTLEALAERMLGSAHRAQEIYEANRNVLASPDLLPIGLTIVIPPRLSGGDLEPAREF